MSSKRRGGRAAESTGRPSVERRKPPGRLGSVRWARSLLARPLALERRQGGRLELKLVDRRRTPEQIEAEAAEELRRELQVRLVAHEMSHAAKVMRHLVAVHDVLGRKGWNGVGRMSSRLLAKAALQARMLSAEEESANLLQMAERLLLLSAASQVREELEAAARARAEGDGEAALEISEASAEDYEASERGWVGTVPQALTDGHGRG